jgi:hypothetical protein
MSERWEEGFDRWTPRAGDAGDAGDDTGVDLEREELLRLARELAEQRHAEHERARAELEQLKQALRERAESIGARERELAERERRLDDGKQPKPRRKERLGAVAAEALVARERAALERAHALDERERELRDRQAGLEAEAADVAARERALAEDLEAAATRRTQSESELELAAAERARLEEREEEARRIERELASRRIEIEGERDLLLARIRELERRSVALAVGEPGSPEDARFRELHALEDKLDLRERELALVRQGVDAERNALLDRERALRRRETADVRQVFEPPFLPPSFSDGLAAFARDRARKSR